MLRLKIRDSHLACKVANKCLNVCERVEVIESKKDSIFMLTTFLLVIHVNVFYKEYCTIIMLVYLEYQFDFVLHTLTLSRFESKIYVRFTV